MFLFGLFDIFGPSGILLAIVAILIYGERLPEVARTFGKQYMDFKKSLMSFREEFESLGSGVSTHKQIGSATAEPDHEREVATAPKFEVPPAEALVVDPPTTELAGNRIAGV
jgi:sec-independent protein translocase protein TatA